MRYRIREGSPIDILTNIFCVAAWFLVILWAILSGPVGREEATSPQPQSQRIEKEMVIASREDQRPKYREVELEVAAYAPLDNKSGICADETPLTTCSGTKPAKGTVAANLKVFPVGTKLFIPGYGYGVVRDTGAVVRRHTDKIEVVMGTYEEAMQWGRKELTVLVCNREDL